MRSFAYRAGVSIAADQVGAGVFVVVITYPVAGAAAVGWAVRGPSCVCSFRGAGIIGGHTFEELGNLVAVVRGAPASLFVYASADSVLVEYDVEFSYSFPCVGANVFIECMYVNHDGEGEWELLRWRCECAYDYAIDHE
jgi:hypothetical protein